MSNGHAALRDLTIGTPTASQASPAVPGEAPPETQARPETTHYRPADGFNDCCEENVEAAKPVGLRPPRSQGDFASRPSRIDRDREVVTQLAPQLIDHQLGGISGP